jgi:hypothetical protein
MRLLKTIFCLVIFVFTLAVKTEARAACAAFTQWEADGGTTAWNTANNWNPANVPNANTESARIVSDWFFPDYPNSDLTLSCLEISSGQLTSTRARTLTIQGDYFRNTIKGSLIVSNTGWVISMSSAATQELHTVDNIPRLTVANTGTLNIKGDFTITTNLTINAGSGTINIEDNLQVTPAITIPASATIVVKNGATLKAMGGITVNGILKIEAGGNLEIGNGTTLSVPVGGLFQLAGASGNIASLTANNSGTFTFTVAGSLNANYFSISRTVAAGVNVTGTIQQLNNGDFHNIATNGYAMTWGAAVVAPATITNVGFFDEGAGGTQRNINATTFNVSAVTFNNWSGKGGAANETDPNSRLTWGTQDTPKLKMSNRTVSGSPAATIATGSADTLFMTYGFSMTGTASTATDITSITFTIAGSNNSADVNTIKVYKDTNANCVYNAGVDTIISSALTPTGEPGTATLSLGIGDLNVIDTTEKCIHVLLATSSTAQNGSTLAVSIVGTDDVINSEDYDWATSGAPPLQGGTSTVTGANTQVWHGGNGDPTNGGSFAQTNNWTSAALPTNALDCQIGVGYSYPNFPDTTERSCRNASLTDGGRMNWASLTTMFSIYGSLNIGSSYTFSNATTGTIAFKGTTNQSITASTTFPGNITIANTGATVSLNTSWTITGNFTLTSGTFVITSGNTFTVNGNVNVNGGVFRIEPGATLIMGDNRIFTVALGGTLEMIGNSGQNAVMTSAATTQDYTVVINGTIKAQYYAFSRLGTTGVTINSGATIGPTYTLQNGSFSYPVNSTSTLLTLNRQVPGNAIANITFDKAGSAATTITNILTNTTAGTLAITNYNGDVAGESFDNDPTYAVTWGTPTNTINVTQEATSSGTVNQGDSYIYGRYGFKQTQAGAFNNTNITSLKFTLTGTGDSNDVANLRAYYDSDCNSTGGTLIGQGSFSGSPATVTLSGLSGVTVEAHATTPPLRCVYVEVVMASLATADETIGVKIEASSDIVNSENYQINPSAAPPLNLGAARTIVGTTSVWTGATSTAWNLAGNWNGGIPTSTMNCIINTATRNPTIPNGVTANCKSLVIGNGTLTMAATSTLNVYGGFENTGTFTQAGQTLVIRDNGVNATNQTINSSSTIQSISFNKTAAGGSVSIDSTTLTVTNLLNITAGNNFEFRIPDGKTLRVNGGATLSAATFTIEGGGTLLVASGQTVTVSGGTFRMNGVLEAQPGGDPLNSYYSLFSTKKALMTPVSGTYSFNSTSGSIYMNGFVVNGLDTNGFRVGGTTALTKLDGGQFAGLSTSYASVRAIQLNTTGSIPTSATKIGFNWETSAGTEANTPPNNAAYLLAFSSGCSNQTIDFTEWYGDWYEEVATFQVSTKKSNASCTINFGGSSSAVSLLSFEATPYDSKVDLNWSTIFEQDHTGFNVYRANSEGEEFTKLNPTLIRNTLSSITFKGKYRFIDDDVENGKTYHYYIQDVDHLGNGELHGPKIAGPLALYGNPPAIAGDVNDGGSSDEGDLDPGASPFGSIKNPSFKDLGGGVQILSQTSTHLRLKINPPTANFSTSAWNASYEKVAMESYGQTESPGKPQLLKRQLLIEVRPFAESFEIVSEVPSSSSLGTKKIQPAPNYVLNGSNILEANYNLDAAAYSANSFTPSAFYQVESNLLSAAGKKYLVINVYPLKYNAASEEVLRLDQVILDIALDGDAWEVEVPSNSTHYSAAIVANTLRINFEQKGMLELRYSDLEDSYTEAPFKDRNINELRLYKGRSELPIFIDDQNSDGLFNNLDKIYFFANFDEKYFDQKNQVVLSSSNLFSSADNPKRFNEVDGTIVTNRVEKHPDILQQLILEQNNDVLLYERLGDNEDHFIWKLLRSTPGFDVLSMSAALPYLNTSSNEQVNLHLKVKGQELGFGDTEYEHHLGVFINGEGSPSKELFFTNKDIQTLSFTLPHHKFIAGNNTIAVKAIGTDAQALAQLDRVAIDSLIIDYYAHKSADGKDVLDFINDDPNSIVTLRDFSSSNIHLWDLSNLDDPALIINTSIIDNGDGSHNLRFESNDGNGEYGQRYLALTSSKYLRPSALSLSEGSDLPLKSTSNEAHFIILGEKFLTDVVKDLVDKRVSEGIKTKVVTLEQVYAEFSQGIVSAEAIRDFINYAKASWTVKPKYLLILGDGNYDMKERLSSSSLERGDTPMVLEGARFIDYATDNYFVSSSTSSLPQLAVGRIPTNSAGALKNYIKKQLAYESGDKMPLSGLRNMSFIAGEELNNSDPDEDQFDLRVAEFINLNSKFSKDTISWHSLGGNAATKSAVIDRFETDTPYLLTYMGHGAPNLWGSLSFILNTDMDQLSNEKLPIVMSLNCDNTLFYDAERVSTSRTIGEALILNKSGGAIAFIGSSTQTTPAAQTYFAKAFHSKMGEHLARPYHRLGLGDLLLEAKLSLGNDLYSKDIMKSTMLFGDPTMPIEKSLFTPTQAAPTAAGKSKGGCSLVKGETQGPADILWGLLEIGFLILLYRRSNRLMKKI